MAEIIPSLSSCLRKMTSGERRFARRVEALLCRTDEPDPNVGTLMLGTWNQELKQALRTREPYASTLKRRPRAKRNFHCESLALSDIQFQSIECRIRNALQVIFDYAT